MAIDIDPVLEHPPVVDPVVVDPWLDDPFDDPVPPSEQPPDAGAPFETPADADVPFRPKQLGPSDKAEYVRAAASGVSFAWVLCLVMDWSEPLTFGIWALIWFVVATYAMARARTSKVVAMDRLVTTLIWLSGAIAVSALLWMVGFVFVKGIGGLVDELPVGGWIARLGAVAVLVGAAVAVRVIVRRRTSAEDGPTALQRVLPAAVGTAVGIAVLAILLPVINTEFFTSDIAEVGPLDEGGGIYHALVGTLEQITIATIIAVPIAILTAVYLHEIKGKMAKPVRFIVDAMSGLPSIVAGLIVFTIWNNEHGFSGASAGVALAIMMIPIVTRTSEEILRTIDNGLRESALALGAPQWRSVVQVILPTARAGLITASILGVARAIGETAPVLLTAFGSAVTNYNPFSSPQADLPLFIWGLLREPNEAQIARAWSAAVVLLLLVMTLFVTARVIGERGARKRAGR
jgi:phosphate transport system permease protein